MRIYDNKALDWGYDSCCKWVRVFPTAEQLAEEYLANNNNILEAAESLIQLANVKGSNFWFSSPVLVDYNFTSCSSNMATLFFTFNCTYDYGTQSYHGRL